MKLDSVDIRQTASATDLVFEALRKAIIEGIRKNSQDANQSKDMAIMDVNAGAIDALFAQTGTDVLIHGHTHRPALHRLDGGKLRYVLPDWEYDVETPRGGWISLTADSKLHRYDAAGTKID